MEEQGPGMPPPSGRVGRRRLAVLLGVTLLAGSLLIAVAFAGRGGPLRSTKRPKLTGTAEVGHVLRSTHGRWSRKPTRYRVRWRRCNAHGRRCATIRRASGLRYRLVARDAGHRIRSVVTASRPGAKTASGRRRRVSVSASSRVSPVVTNPRRQSGGSGSGTAGAGGSGTPSPTGTPAPGSGGAPMPLISRNKPAFTNDDCGGSHPAHDANDSDYESHWATCDSNVSAGSPKWLAYDLSSVPAADRGAVVVAWFNDPVTSEYDHTVTGGPGYNNAGAFSIQVNDASGGGSPPSGGWTTVRSVSGNTFNSWQARIDMAGANWVRLFATASDGSPQNEGILLNFDVHSARAGVTDDWIFYGDSITQDGMSHDSRMAPSGGKVGTFSDEVHARVPDHFPLYQDGGIGGLISADGAGHIDQWLPAFPGRFVSLAYGTNDANNAGPGDPDIAKPFHDNMEAMVTKVLAAGKTPILPTIPWGDTAALRANVPVLNHEIERLRQQHPKIVAGPDFYALFNGNQGLISNDGVHPSEAGYAAMRQAWAAFAAKLYAGMATRR